MIISLVKLTILRLLMDDNIEQRIRNVMSAVFQISANEINDRLILGYDNIMGLTKAL